MEDEDGYFVIWVPQRQAERTLAKLAALQRPGREAALVEEVMEALTELESMMHEWEQPIARGIAQKALASMKALISPPELSEGTSA